MSCSKCGKNYSIVNKKYGLCADCNYIRINGRSRTQVYAERSAAKPVKIYRLQSHKPIKQQTTKDKGVKQQLSILKSTIELEAVQDGTYYCKGCGKSHCGLDKSHILSVGQHKHLELEKDNIDLLCRDCHMAWESGDIARMAALHCFQRYLEYMRENSEEFYSKIVHKMQDSIKWKPAGIVAEKIENILKIIGQKVA